MNDIGTLERSLRPLTPLHGKAALARWAELAAAGDWDTLVAELLVAPLRSDIRALAGDALRTSASRVSNRGRGHLASGLRGARG